MWYFGADTKNQRTHDSINIINYIFNNFEYVDLSNYINENFIKYKKYDELNVYMYKTKTPPIIDLENTENCVFPIKKNSSNLISTKFYGLNILSSKITKNTKIGILQVLYDNKILCSKNIILTNNLLQNSWYYYFYTILKNWQEAFKN